MPEPFANLNIHAAEAWHDEAFVIGDVVGLTALRDAIDRVLAAQAQGGDARTKVEAMLARDGEGFYVRVGCFDQSTLGGLMLPYRSDLASDGSGNLPDYLFADMIAAEAADIKALIAESNRQQMLKDHGPFGGPKLPDSPTPEG